MGTEAERRFVDFQLAEYESIAQAHFNTTTAISTFFRNYLVIVGLPIPALGLVISQFEKADDAATRAQLSDYTFLVPLAGLLVAAVGFLVLVYIANLRFDALLYARTVNAIRQFFFDRSTLTVEQQHVLRVLPRTPNQPSYFEPRFFGAVILVFALFDSFYAVAGCLWYVRSGPSWLQALAIPVDSQIGIGFAAVMLAIAAHFVIYWLLAEHRETSYLRKRIIGVDIDGVLNDHRTHFCRLLHELCGKTVEPDKITKIPVHECTDLGITESEEHAVFNHPKYWQEMPALNEAAIALARIHNALGYEVRIFTHRPWPERKTFPKGREAQYEWEWRAVSRFWRLPIPRSVVGKLTATWLRRSSIPFDKLVIEKGNVHTADPGSRVKNRFVEAGRRGIRLFVEDDLDKAQKLAGICEAVFLLDQPYNQATCGLPPNLIRVKSWPEIYRFIRRAF